MISRLDCVIFMDFIHGEKIKDIAKRFDVSPGRISQRLKKVRVTIGYTNRMTASECGARCRCALARSYVAHKNIEHGTPEWMLQVINSEPRGIKQ